MENFTESTPHESPDDAAGDSPPDRSELIQSRGVVLAILFLVTGFLGIPLLWMNRRFSTAERWFWTVTVTVYTFALIAGTAWVLWWVWQRLSA